MATHMGVLPDDFLDTITKKANEHEGDPSLGPDGLASIPLLRLPHPRTAVPSLFLPYRRPEPAGGSGGGWGILEVQSVSPPNPRSWFFTEGEVVSDGKLLKDGSAGIFQPMDDIFDEAASKIVQGSTTIPQEDLISLTRYDCIIDALKRVCDFQDITPELKVYRYSEDKVIEYLQAKVTRLSRHEVVEKSRTIIRNFAKDGLMDDGKEDLLELGRTRSACDLVSQYLAPSVYSALLAKYDFTPLETHIKAVKAEDMAVALAGAPMAKSRAAAEEDGDNKKRKAKSKASRGVEILKKVDVSKMGKMSTYFQKK
ncbi:Ydr279p protein family-domain-containing protein [Lactarius sanguifluus]|nr:Ydr279p protein family-domain-containing protein [Lactarius sanguifluus]